MPDRARRDEILAWLKLRQNVRRFAVLLDQLPLFQPPASIGISERIAEGLAAYLLQTTNEDMRCSRVERLLQNIGSMIRGHPDLMLVPPAWQWVRQRLWTAARAGTDEGEKR